jgi:hypothetical protein
MEKDDLRATIEVKIPTGVIETIADMVANRVGERSPSKPERWIGVEEAAAHLAGVPEIPNLRPRVVQPDSSRAGGSRLLFRRADLDDWVIRVGGRRRYSLTRSPTDDARAGRVPHLELAEEIGTHLVPGPGGRRGPTLRDPGRNPPRMQGVRYASSVPHPT